MIDGWMDGVGFIKAPEEEEEESCARRQWDLSRHRIYGKEEEEEKKNRARPYRQCLRTSRPMTKGGERESMMETRVWIRKRPSLVCGCMRKKRGGWDGVG